MMSLPFGEWQGVGAAEYHGRTDLLGHSMFEVFLENPRRFESLFVAKTAEDADSDARFLGRVIHCAILEPDQLEHRYFRAPALAPDGARWNRSKREHKAAWAEVVLSNLGKAPVSDEDWAVVDRIRDCVEDNPEATALRAAATATEAALLWPAVPRGFLVRCKTMRDLLVVDGNHRVIVDVKSMPDVSPAGFRKWGSRYALHRTAAWYRRGEREMYPEAVIVWLCWAVSKETGESALYELDEEDLAVAEGEIDRGLERFVKSREAGDWRAPWESGVTRVRLNPGAVLYSDL